MLYFLHPFLGKEGIRMSQYIITDGSRFIFRNHFGKYVPTPSEAMADIYTKKQAEGICKCSLPKTLRGIFHVQKYDITPENVKQVSQSDLVNNTDVVIISQNIQVWLDKVSGLNGLRKDAKKRKEELCKQLSDVDKELSDINHYIEFCNLNAAQGYKAYKMIKERRIKRRTIKNELVVVETILEKRLSDSIAEEIEKVIHNLNVRTYTPRILNELFDL